MVPKWLTSYLANYVTNQWSNAFSPISNPSVFEVLYLVKYFGGFKYFISHDIKNRFKNAVTLIRPSWLSVGGGVAVRAQRNRSVGRKQCPHVA